MTVAAVSGSGIAVAVGGGSGVTVGGTGVCVGVPVGGTGVGVATAVGGTGVAVGTACAPPHPTSNNTTSAKPNSCSDRFRLFTVLLLSSPMQVEFRVQPGPKTLVVRRLELGTGLAGVQIGAGPVLSALPDNGRSGPDNRGSHHW